MAARRKLKRVNPMVERMKQEAKAAEDKEKERVSKLSTQELFEELKSSLRVVNEVDSHWVREWLIGARHSIDVVARAKAA